MADVLGTILTATLWLMGVSGLGIGIALYMVTKKFKYVVRVRKIVKGRTLIIDDKAREIRDPKTGVQKWKLRKLKKYISIPPDDCLDTTEKGKIIYECYMTGDGNIVPIKDNFDIAKFKSENSETFDPVTTQQRSLLFDEYEKADEYTKNKNDALMRALIAWGPPIIIIVIILIFAPDIIGKVGEVLDKFGAVADKFGDVADKLDQVINAKAVISGAEVNQGTNVVPN